MCSLLHTAPWLMHNTPHPTEAISGIKKVIHAGWQYDCCHPVCQERWSLFCWKLLPHKMKTDCSSNQYRDLETNMEAETMAEEWGQGWRWRERDTEGLRGHLSEPSVDLKKKEGGEQLSCDSQPVKKDNCTVIKKRQKEWNLIWMDSRSFQVRQV